MGLFDRLVKKQVTELDPQSALTLAAMTMIAADGAIEDEEIDILNRINRNNRNAFDKAYKVWKTSNFNDCVELVNNSLNSDQKLAVMANLIDIAMSDGLLAGKEKDLLGAYMSTFNLNDGAVEKMIDVVSLKNDFTVFG